MATKKGQQPSSKVEVPAVSTMLAMTFRQHTMLRHPRLKFKSKEEHAKDHELNAAELDHTHKPDEAPEPAGTDDSEETADAEAES